MIVLCNSVSVFHDFVITPVHFQYTHSFASLETVFISHIYIKSIQFIVVNLLHYLFKLVFVHFASKYVIPLRSSHSLR